MVEDSEVNYKNTLPWKNILTKCGEAVLEAKSAPFTGDAPCGRFDQKKSVAVLTKCSVAVLVASQLMWPFWPKQCGRFDQSSVAVLVVIPLSVAVLVVAVLECGRFDWFPIYEGHSLATGAE